MDALKGMYKIGKILEKLTEIEATIEFKRKRGEKPTVDNFLFLGNPGYASCTILTESRRLLFQVLTSEHSHAVPYDAPHAVQDGKDGCCKDDAKDDVEAWAARGQDRGDYSAGDPRLSPVPAKVIDHPLREPRQGTHPATHEPRGSHGPPQR